MKNAIIINGKVYIAKRVAFYSLGQKNVCEICDLKRRCDNNQNCFCAPFEKARFVPYFKLKK